MYIYFISFFWGSSRFKSLSAYTFLEAVNKITSNIWDTLSKNSRKNGRVRTNTCKIRKEISYQRLKTGILTQI